MNTCLKSCLRIRPNQSDSGHVLLQQSCARGAGNLQGNLLYNLLSKVVHRQVTDKRFGSGYSCMNFQC